jgi:galactonate dehydratase
MKITNITCKLAFGGRQNWVFVLVETDAGVTGVGEASLEGKEKAVEAAVGDMARFIIGRDPTRIQQAWQIMYRHGFWRGGVVLMTAMSGIDQALWDIVGKELGVPVYRLLGGAARDRMELYTHVHGRPPTSWPSTRRRWCQRLARAQDGQRQFRAISTEQQAVDAFACGSS